MQVGRNLSRYCIYAIRHTDRLADVYENEGGSCSFRENSRWVTGERLFSDAQKNGEQMPVVFAAAEKWSGLLYYAMLNAVEIDSDVSETRYSFTGLTPFDKERPKSSLIKKSDRKPLSDNHIRSYVICLTPDL